MKQEEGKTIALRTVGFDSLIKVQAIIANAQSRAEYKHLGAAAVMEDW